MNKTKFLTAAVILLVILNAATLFFLFKGHGKKPPVRNGGRPFTEFISKQLNFDTAQTGQLQLLRDKHKAELDTLRKEDKVLHDSLFAFVKRGDMDSVKIDSYLTRISVNKKEFELAFIHHFAQIRSICKPEQLDLFNKMVDQMMKRRMPSFNGPGGGDDKKDSPEKK
jgi:periplasmic protein CpxP/Spy